MGEASPRSYPSLAFVSSSSWLPNEQRGQSQAQRPDYQDCRKEEGGGNNSQPSSAWSQPDYEHGLRNIPVACSLIQTLERFLSPFESKALTYVYQCCIDKIKRQENTRKKNIDNTKRQVIKNDMQNSFKMNNHLLFRLSLCLNKDYTISILLVFRYMWQ